MVHAEGAGNDGAQEDHDAVELAQLVAAQHGEGDGGGDAVEEDGGDETPHEDRHPGYTSQLTSVVECGSGFPWIIRIDLALLDPDPGAKESATKLGIYFDLLPAVGLFFM